MDSVEVQTAIYPVEHRWPKDKGVGPGCDASCEENHCHAERRQGEPGRLCRNSAGFRTPHGGAGPATSTAVARLA